MNWSVLGIEETKDLKQIKAAYLNRLKSVNPEDSPEKFMELRAAYEEAVRLAQEEIHEEAGDLVSSWMQRVEDVYWDFAKRRDAGVWRDLLSASVCNEAATKSQAEEQLLTFLMDNWILSQDVWRELDLQFGFSYRLEELKAEYPAAFVENVVDRGIRFREALPFELFTPGTDGHEIDEYAYLYFDLRRGEEIPAEKLQQLKDMKEHHPFGDIMIAAEEWKNGSAEAEKTMRLLADRYPEEETVLLAAERAYFNREAYEKALAVLEPHMGEHKDHLWMRVDYVFCLTKNGRYREAYDEYCLISKRFDDVSFKVPNMKQYMDQCCEELLTQYTRLVTAGEDPGCDPTDAAWWYIHNGRMDEAYDVLTEGDPSETEENSLGYYNALFVIYSDRCEYEEAIREAQNAIKVIEGLEPDGTEKTELDLKRIPEMKARIGMCYMSMGRKDTGLDVLRSAVSESEYKWDTVSAYAQAMMQECNYLEAVRAIDECFRKNEVVDRLVFVKAQALFNMHADREAYDCFTRFIQTGYPYLGAYVYRVHILIRNGAYEDAGEGLGEIRSIFLRDGASEETYPDILWLDLYLNLEMSRESYEQYQYDDGYDEAQKEEQKEKRHQFEASSLEEYRRIDGIIQEKQYKAYWIPEFYLHYAKLTETVLRYQGKDDPDLLLKLIQKGLEYDENDSELLLYQGSRLYEAKSYDEAYDNVYRVFTQGKLSEDSKRDLLQYMSNRIDRYADRVLEVAEDLIASGYDGQEDDEETVSLKCSDHFDAGRAAYNLGDLDKALYHYNIVKSIDPDSVIGLRGYGIVALSRGQYEEAISCMDRAIEVIDKEKEGIDEYYRLIKVKILALRRLGRWEEAVSEARKLDRNDRELLIHRILCQFGQFDADYEHLMWWKKHRREYKYTRDCRAVMLDHWTLMGKNVRCSYASVGLVLDLTVGSQDYEELSSHAAARGCFSEAWNFWRSNYSVDYDDYPGNYRTIKYLLYNRMTDGRKPSKHTLSLAEELLSKEEEFVKLYTGKESLYLRNKALILAAMGRRKEALETVRAMRENRLCTECPYSTCVDADICEMYIEAFTGDKAKACGLCRIGLEKWPGEVEFRIVKAYLHI